MNIIEQLEAEQTAKLSAERPVPNFDAGATLRVHVKVVEGSRERVQVFEGVCIARKNAGLNSAFTVRKLSYGEGVERIFPLYSPRIDKIEVVRHGKVRRAKLYYLRGRTGKRARIAERTKARVQKAVGAELLEAASDPTQVATAQEAYELAQAAEAEAQAQAPESGDAAAEGEK